MYDYDLVKMHQMASVMTSVQSELKSQKIASPTLVRSRPSRKGNVEIQQTTNKEK